MVKMANKHKINYCKACGRIITITSKDYCSKHLNQVKKYGKVLDNNPRNTHDPNEVRVYYDHAEVDTYDVQGNVNFTYLIDVEDVPKLVCVKWATRFHDGNPYLVSGGGDNHIVFHRMILRFPVGEVDHINRNTLDNRKSNLRVTNRFVQCRNASLRVDNHQGVRGVHFCKSKGKYIANLQYDKKRYFSPAYDTREEAVYWRYIAEQLICLDGTTYNEMDTIYECIKKVTPEQKEAIQKYFRNTSNRWG